MLDFDGGKLLIIGIVALIVIGPKELPGVLRQVGQAMAKMRRMAAEFQGQFMEAMREAELDDLRKDVTKMAQVDLKGLDPFDPLRKDMAALKADVDSALDPHVLDHPATSTELNVSPDVPAEHSPTVVVEDTPPVAATPGEVIGNPLPMPAPLHVPEPAPASTPASGGHA